MHAVNSIKDSALGSSVEILRSVRRMAKDKLAPLANRIDQEGLYPVEMMQDFGQQGAFAAHLDRYGQQFNLALQNMQSISRYCGSTGFMAWCQNACGLYMEQSDNKALLDRLDDQAFAKRLGGTGLSNPMKSISGIETMALHATKVNGGYHVTGTLPWVSNIGPNQYFGAVAMVKNTAGEPLHAIFFLLDIDDTVTLNKCPTFSGMEGTSTWGVTVKDYFVGDDRLISDNAAVFVKRVRSAFILLQAGWGLGVIEGAIESCREVETGLGHVNQYLHNRPDQLQSEFDDLHERVLTLAGDPYSRDKDHCINVLDARAQVSELALKASESALLHQGARGYLMESDVQRRIREAHFVAIVSPAIKHIRWEIARLMKEEMPG